MRISAAHMPGRSGGVAGGGAQVHVASQCRGQHPAGDSAGGRPGHGHPPLRAAGPPLTAAALHVRGAPRSVVRAAVMRETRERQMTAARALLVYGSAAPLVRAVFLPPKQLFLHHCLHAPEA